MFENQKPCLLSSRKKTSVKKGLRLCLKIKSPVYFQVGRRPQLRRDCDKKPAWSSSPWSSCRKKTSVKKGLRLNLQM